MNYSETLDYLYQSLPMFHRIGAAAIKPDLTNTLALCGHLGNPHHRFRTIHVAGTNGKGSTSHMLAAILQSAGYRTGLYTSPHLKSFTERIRINGEEIGQQAVVDFVAAHREFLETLQPSFFEMTVGMAFNFFAAQRVDIAVIEVGLGGRLDSTNVITPELALITNISFDHQALLGNTLTEIAREKGGIIKPGIPVVVSERQPEAAEVFRSLAEQQRAPLTFAADHYRVAGQGNRDGKLLMEVKRNGEPFLNGLECQLMGAYQLKNVAGVLQAVEVLNGIGLVLSEAAVRQGIGQVSTLTGLKGRWQTLSTDPLVVCDTGHNEDGIRAVMEQVHSTKHRQLHVVLGVVNDKDLSRIMPLLPLEAKYYFCQPNIPRALPASMLQETALQYGLNGKVVPDVNQAIAQAKAQAHSEDLIFIGGSTFVVAEVEGL
jgi:dihydrofolate synthase / folylpolyglutamate synthase